MNRVKRQVVWSIVGALMLVSGFGACGAAPASPEMTAQAERRLLAPFLGNHVVVCDELVVDMTGNFDKCVTLPGVDAQLHRFDVRREAGAIEKVWTNASGLEAGWFTITICAAPDPADVSGRLGPRTTYKVLNRFVRRTHGGELALSATAAGGTVTVVADGGPVQKLREFQIADGVVRQ